MAIVIEADDVVVDEKSEIDALTLEYHKDLCGCDRTDPEYLVNYREVVAERYERGEYA